jgi:hypothetical protein
LRLNNFCFETFCFFEHVSLDNILGGPYFSRTLCSNLFGSMAVCAQTLCCMCSKLVLKRFWLYVLKPCAVSAQDFLAVCAQTEGLSSASLAQSRLYNAPSVQRLGQTLCCMCSNLFVCLPHPSPSLVLAFALALARFGSFFPFGLGGRLAYFCCNLRCRKML